jgi:hypothetical protein
MSNIGIVNIYQEFKQRNPEGEQQAGTAYPYPEDILEAYTCAQSLHDYMCGAAVDEYMDRIAFTLAEWYRRGETDAKKEIKKEK